MPEETLKGWRWPQLVVLGDGNTGNYIRFDNNNNTNDGDNNTGNDHNGDDVDGGD